MYAGICWRDGSSSASIRTRPCSSGCSSSKRANAWKPRTTFFDGSVRSTRRTRNSGRSATSSARPRAPPRSRRARRTRPRRPTPDGSASGTSGRRSARRRPRSTSASSTRRSSGGSCRATARCGGRPRRSRAAPRGPRVAASGSTPPVVGLGPRDVDEVDERRVRALLTHEAGREIQVVVVEEHGRAGPAVELVAHRVRERAVHRRIARPPRGQRAASTSGSVRAPYRCWRNQSVGLATTL